MSNEHHNGSLALVEARVNSMEEAVVKLVDISDGQAKMLNVVNTTLRLMEQRQASAERIQEQHTAKLDILNDNKATMKGGWIALCAIGTVLVGLSSVIGALVAWLALKGQ